jgi:sortase A
VRPGRITGALGLILLGFGALVLLFAAYQLWGTNLFEARSQAQLRQQFDAELHQRHSRPAQPSSSSPNTTEPATSVPDVVLAPVAAPPEGRPLGIIQIPKIGVDKVMVQGTGTSDLQEGPGHYSATALPGQVGNVAIAGHRTTYGAPFYNLDALVPGDLIILTTTWGTFSYAVTASEIVAPTNLSPLAPSTRATLTLTTCTPRFSASQRLVVMAALRSAPALVGPKPSGTETSRSDADRADTRHADSGGSSLGGAQGDWVPAFLWGLAATAVGTAVWLVAQRRRRGRWLVYAAGSVAFLIVLFFFFTAVSPLLPASY